MKKKHTPPLSKHHEILCRKPRHGSYCYSPCGATAFGTTSPFSVSITHGRPLYVSNVDNMLSSESSIAPPMIVGDDTDGETSVARILFFYLGYQNDDLSVDEFPLGCKLTRGEKLHEEGLTRKGIKVAVIDDGISAAHPIFDGNVVQQTWFHTDPIGEHGTHVAGTIQ